MRLLWEIVCQLFKKINIDLPHVSAFPLLNIYPREYKHIYQQKLIDKCSQNIYL